MFLRNGSLFLDEGEVPFFLTTFNTGWSRLFLRRILMTDKVKAVPDGFHSITPHLTVRDATRALEFYQKAFGAEVLDVSPAPGGKVMHATIKIGDSILMLNDEFPEYGGDRAPTAAAGSGVALHIYLENVDAAFERALSAGATVKMPLRDQFWGDRYGTVIDPFGHKWSLATHTRDMSQEEIQQEQEKAFANMPKSA
jgi:PhnB protein